MNSAMTMFDFCRAYIAGNGPEQREYEWQMGRCPANAVEQLKRLQQDKTTLRQVLANLNAAAWAAANKPNDQKAQDDLSAARTAALCALEVTK